jgi:hypothetical protein
MVNEETAKELIAELRALNISIRRLLAVVEKIKIPGWLKK